MSPNSVGQEFWQGSAGWLFCSMGRWLGSPYLPGAQGLVGEAGRLTQSYDAM